MVQDTEQTARLTASLERKHGETMLSKEEIIDSHRIILALLGSDEDFSDEEEEFFDRMLGSFTLTPAERGAAHQPLTLEQAKEKAAAMPRSMRMALLHLLVKATLADGVVDDRETEFMIHIAGAMNIDEAATRYLIEEEKKEQSGEP